MTQTLLRGEAGRVRGWAVAGTWTLATLLALLGLPRALEAQVLGGQTSTWANQWDDVNHGGANTPCAEWDAGTGPISIDCAADGAKLSGSAFAKNGLLGVSAFAGTTPVAGEWLSRPVPDPSLPLEMIRVQASASWRDELVWSALPGFSPPSWAVFEFAVRGSGNVKHTAPAGALCAATTFDAQAGCSYATSSSRLKTWGLFNATGLDEGPFDLTNLQLADWSTNPSDQTTADLVNWYAVPLTSPSIFFEMSLDMLAAVEYKSLVLGSAGGDFSHTAGLTGIYFADAHHHDITNNVTYSFTNGTRVGPLDLETETPTTTPEPVTMTLVGAGLLGVAAARRRRLVQ